MEVQQEREPKAPTPVPVGVKITDHQLGLFEPDITRVMVEPVGLSRMTWRDHVAGLHEQVAAERLPAWKLRFCRGDYVELRKAYGGAPTVTARVRANTNFPTDFGLPVMVQVGVYVAGKFAEETMVGVECIERHTTDKEGIPF